MRFSTWGINLVCQFEEFAEYAVMVKTILESGDVTIVQIVVLETNAMHS